jgi:hypothetical protein
MVRTSRGKGDEPTAVETDESDAAHSNRLLKNVESRRRELGAL